MSSAAWFSAGALTALIGGFAVLAVVRMGDDPRDDFVCCRCADTGVAVGRWPDGRPVKTWCDCLLGRAYRTAAARPRAPRPND